jgi:hypothetical protein
MDSNKVYSKYIKFADNKTMSRRALRTMTLNWNRPFKIWGSTLEGDTYEGRELFSFNGPSREPLSPATRYNYSARGYMIFFDMNKGAYRTFVYNLITAFEQNGVKYDIV